MNQPAKIEDGIISIRGKNYKTVALRIQEFRADYPLFGLETEVLSQADLVTVKAVIKDEAGRIVATGYAEENRLLGQINKTSAVENCETSAVGRALAFFGLGGTEIASADEVVNAIAQQNNAASQEVLFKHNALLCDLIPSVAVIKGALAQDNYSRAKEAWQELSKEEQGGLWGSVEKGSIFTIAEHDQMRSDEWKEAL